MRTLVDYLLTVATELVRQQGQFYPFAGAVTEDGVRVHVSADVGEEHPQPKEAPRFLEGVLRAGVRAEGLRAVPLARDVGFTDPATGKRVDAIRVHVEHV